ALRPRPFQHRRHLARAGHPQAAAREESPPRPDDPPPAPRPQAGEVRARRRRRHAEPPRGPDRRMRRSREFCAMRSRHLAAVALLAIGLARPAAALDTGRIFVSSERDHSVMVLDGKTLARVAVVKTGNRARHLRLSADRKLLYVAASDSNRID